MSLASPRAVVAVCTFNRAAMLPALVRALRAQQSSVPFSILVVDNDSTDDTAAVIAALAAEPGPLLRSVHEPAQGIVPARNRAIAETLDADYLLFIDDDELPAEGWVEAAVTALRDDGAQCAGGRIRVRFDPHPRPRWLGEDLLGFLGAVDNGQDPCWVTSRDTPIWSGNVAYRTQVFSDDPALRFDIRYNRAGFGIGGGSDARLFQELLSRKVRLRYRPDMVIEHLVGADKLRRSYFVKLHYRSGLRFGTYDAASYSRTVIGVPPFFFRQLLRHLVRTGARMVRGDPGWLRQAMNAAHTAGIIRGRLRPEREASR